MPDPVSGRVFISYRREETASYAGRLYDRLAYQLGDDQIFMDVDTIAPGLDFAAVITQAVSTCQVLLAVIGPRWLSATDEDGQRRLEDPDDIVVMEIAAALVRNIRVIPILVEGARMPRRQQLPDNLAGLARRNAFSVRHESFRADADRLLAAIEPILHPPAASAPAVPGPSQAVGVVDPADIVASPSADQMLRHDEDVSGPPFSPLQLGITRVGPDLKLTVIGHDSDEPELFPFPAKVAERLVGDLRQQVLAVEDASHRALALQSIGDRLANAFLARASFDVGALLAQAPNDLLVLRLDNWTVDLPWELARVDGQPLALSTRLGRQLELSAVGRQAAFVAPHDRLEVLVVGDPTGDLPGASREADAVARLLGGLSRARVTTLVGDVSYADVSRELDTHNYDVFHYAGHARFDVLREDASGLVLADGLLTAQDLASSTHLPRLFIVDACYSAAIGDVRLQEQVEASRATRNLVSGLLGAGARAFVGAMWGVDDQAAATFAAGLYEELVRTGESGGGSIGEAVRRGRQQIITSHGEGQPAWAAYALYGSPWRPAW